LEIPTLKLAQIWKALRSTLKWEYPKSIFQVLIRQQTLDWNQTAALGKKTRLVFYISKKLVM